MSLFFLYVLSIEMLSYVLGFIDEKDGLTVSLKESSRLVEEAKEREARMQNKVRTMEQQVQVLNERDQEVNSVLKHMLHTFYQGRNII